MTRQVISAPVKDEDGSIVQIYLTDMETNISDVINVLSQYRDTYGDNLILSLKDTSWDDTPIYVFRLYEERLENDEEYNERLLHEKRSEDWRREMYEQLKREFGDG